MFRVITVLLTECPETSPYIDPDNTEKCVTLAKCAERSYFVHKETRRCITLEACLALEPKHYAYMATSECFTLPPDEN